MSNGIEHDDQLDGNLKKVLEAVRDYETWTEHDPDRISEMDKTITDLIEKLNGQLILIPQNSDELKQIHWSLSQYSLCSVCCRLILRLIIWTASPSMQIFSR